MMHSSYAVTSGSNAFILGLASSDRAWRSSAMDDSNPAPVEADVKMKWEPAQANCAYRRFLGRRSLCIIQIQRWRNSTAMIRKNTLVNYIRFNLFPSFKLTVASFLTSSSVAPREANPISCENWAKLGLANKGMWPNSSWQQSLIRTSNNF